MANIVDIKEAEEKPESTFTRTTRKDIYTDWFESEEAANKYVEETRNA